MDSKTISRRAFLGYLGTSAATVVTASSGLPLLIGKANAAEPYFGKQTSVLSTLANVGKLPSNDNLNVSSGFTYDLIAAYGDPINTRGDTLGYENAATRYFPIKGSSVHGLLAVSHESSHALLAQEGHKGSYSAQQIRKLLADQGLSVLEVYRGMDGRWKLEPDSAYARRVTGLDAIELTGPVKGAKSVHNAIRVQGTLANHSVTATLWGTALSGEGSYDKSGPHAGLDPTHYGWMTEIDPFDAGFKPRKHTALGRFYHAGTVMKLADNHQLVVYMGDSRGGCLFKFVSRGTFVAAKGRDNSDLLTEGTLYAAHLASGSWIPLSVEAVRKELKRSDFVLPRSIGYSQDQ
jgi:secreted PhoX family phosphatase